MNALNGISWLAMAVFMCAFGTLVWVFETGHRQPDPQHPHEIGIKSSKRYVTAERRQMFDSAGTAIVFTGVLMIGFTLVRFRLDKKR